MKKKDKKKKQNNKTTRNVPRVPHIPLFCQSSDLGLHMTQVENLKSVTIANGKN
jgi:hypothetical protein